ncbi:MAG: acetyl-CoA carboxylase biotin carboxyl carrier protein, partial [Deinococcus sp.]
MDPKDLKDILLALESADVREFSLKTADYELNIRRGVTAPPTPERPPAGLGAAAQLAPELPATSEVAPPYPAATVASAPTVQTPPPATPASAGTPVKAPIVGTFYASSSPDAPAYVKVGDSVQAGQVPCIIEAMKLMNEIEAETSGVVREVLVKNAEPVEYGQT